MQSIGDLLKEAREKRGMSLQEVFDATRITVQNLSALEEDRFDYFPNKVYARAFLRDYSNFLGLDSSELLLRYEEEWKQQTPVAAPQASQKAKGCRSGLAVVLIILIVLIAAVGGYFVWDKYQAEKSFPGYESFQAEPTPYVTPTPTPEVVPSPEVTPVPSPSPIAPTAPAGSAEMFPSPSPIPGESEVMSPTVAPTPEPKPTPVEVKGVEVTLKARTQVWVRVVSDGKRVYEATMPGSKTMTWRGSKMVTIRIAKPGDVALTVNGRQVKLTGNPVIPVTRTFKAQ